jgi:tetratricopeptide (TPR) repeat protein
VEALLRSGKPEEARAALAAARDANYSEVERAQMSALAAQTPKERARAMLAAARAARYDLALWRAAAEAAMTDKDHRSAIEAYGQASKLDPDNILIWNSLAYAQAFAGDVDAAMRSLDQYGKLQPRDPNVFDSKGEILLYHGRFKESEEEFLRAFEMENSRLGGGEAYRAAIAAFLGGDRIKAESNFGRYLEFRKANKDQFVGLRESIWLYTTGRTEEARNKAAVLNLPAAKGQIAIWDAVEGRGSVGFGDRAEFTGWKLLAAGRYAEAVEYWKKLYDANSLTSGNEARMMLAVSLHAAKRQQEAQTLLAKWPLPPTGPEPGFSSVAFGKSIALKAGRR